MLFNSLTFVVFFMVVVTLYWSVRSWNARKNLLVTASYIFYGAWNPPFAALLFTTTAMDFWLGARIAKAKGRARKLWLVASVCMNLSMLGFFKYGNFLLENFKWLMAQIGVIYQPPHLDILLPVGISFYTFHSLSYTLDIYRGVLQPTKSLRDFVLAVSFFPQLVAGPIVRAGDFLPQLVHPPGLRLGQFLWGLLLMTLGLFEKIVLADTMLSGSADRIFDYAGPLVALDSWLGVIAFAGQIFFDFAGYSTCAIGAALCLGFHLKDNFRFPYAAIGFSDFWRRWHISLSTFLRDYLYIPLGGNQVRPVRAAINLVIVMFLGGLWHGAAWTFVVWGLLHGSYLVIERVMRGLFEHKAWANHRVTRLLAGVATLRRGLHRVGVFSSVRFHYRHTNVARHVWRARSRRRHSFDPRNVADRHRHCLHDAGALVAARQQHRNSGDASAALGRNRGVGLDGLRHHSHSRKQQCLHLLPILSACCGCRVCSSAEPTREKLTWRSAARIRAADPADTVARHHRGCCSDCDRGLGRVGILCSLDWLRSHAQR